MDFTLTPKKPRRIRNRLTVRERIYRGSGTQHLRHMIQGPRPPSCKRVSESALRVLTRVRDQWQLKREHTAAGEEAHAKASPTASACASERRGTLAHGREA